PKVKSPLSRHGSPSRLARYRRGVGRPAFRLTGGWGDAIEFARICVSHRWTPATTGAGSLARRGRPLPPQVKGPPMRLSRMLPAGALLTLAAGTGLMAGGGEGQLQKKVDLRSAANPFDPDAGRDWLVPDERLKVPFAEEVPIRFVSRNQDPEQWEKLPQYWNEGSEQVIDPGPGKPVTRKVILLKLPLGLTQPPAVPPENPMTLHKWVLGKKLYFDKLLSSDGTVACASCHDPAKGFTDQRK